MFETSKSILENHMFLIEKYGFIPNGSRVYYLNRSQPPYFALMVMKFYEYCLTSKELSLDEKRKYKSFVFDKALVYVVKEYEFWMSERSIKVTFGQNEFMLNVFSADNQKPRPESYSEDINTAKSCTTDKERANLYKNIAAGFKAHF